jgi:hypothetical protein
LVSHLVKAPEMRRFFIWLWKSENPWNIGPRFSKLIVELKRATCECTQLSADFFILCTDGREQ